MALKVKLHLRFLRVSYNKSYANQEVGQKSFLPKKNLSKKLGQRSFLPKHFKSSIYHQNTYSSYFVSQKGGIYLSQVKFDILPL